MLPYGKKKQLAYKKKRKGKNWTKQRIRRNYINACCDLWSILIRHRDKVCVWCGGSKLLQAHHIVSKALLGGNLSGYIDLGNGMALCYNCHINRLKSEPDEYILIRNKFLENLNKKLSHSIYQDMREKYKMKTKISLDDLKIIYEHDLKAQVVALKIYSERLQKIHRRWIAPMEKAGVL